MGYGPFEQKEDNFLIQGHWTWLIQLGFHRYLLHACQWIIMEDCASTSIFYTEIWVNFWPFVPLVKKIIWNFYQSQLNILRLSSMPEQSTPTLPKSCKRTIEILLLHSTLSCLIPEDKSYAIPNTEPKIDREPKKNKASGRLKFVVPKTPTKQQKKSNPKSSSFSHPISNTGTEINKLSSES